MNKLFAWTDLKDTLEIQALLQLEGLLIATTSVLLGLAFTSSTFECLFTKNYPVAECDGKQIVKQQSLSAAKLICQMFRQESCHASTVKQSEERTRREETRSEPSWTPGGPSRGRLERQEVRPEAVLAAKRPVWRPSWPPGGPSGGRLERHQAG